MPTRPAPPPLNRETRSPAGSMHVMSPEGEGRGPGGAPAPRAPLPPLTLNTETCSLCSWSRYFSMLKKVSKKTLASLHFFRS